MASGDLVINLIARTQQWNRGLSSAQGRFSSFLGSAINGFGKLGLAIQGVKASVGLIKSGIDLLAFPVQLAAQAEQIEVAFTTMLKSADLAKKTLGELREFTASTPFQEMEVNKAAKSLLAFGSSAGDVTDELRMIGDIASGVGIPLGDLAMIYGKARVEGRIMSQELNQLTGRGIPVMEEFAKILGVGEDQVRKMVEQGKVGFPELQKAFQNLTTGAGDFSGMMDKQSKTLAGQWSTLKDNVLAALREIGVAIIGEFDLKQVTANLTEFVKNFKTDWMPEIKSGLKEIASVFKDIGGLIDDFKFIDNKVSKNDFARNTVTQLGENMNPADVIKGLEGGDLSMPASIGEQTKALQDQTTRLRELLASVDADVQKSRQARESAMETTAATAAAERLKKIGEGGFGDLPKRLAQAIEKPLAKLDLGIAQGTRAVGDSGIGQKFEDFLTKPGSLAEMFAGDEKEEDSPEIRTLAEASQESFDVLRANVGQEKVGDEQLKVAQKSEKHLADIAKSMKDKSKSVNVKIGEIG